MKLLASHGLHTVDSWLHAAPVLIVVIDFLAAFVRAIVKGHTLTLNFRKLRWIPENFVAWSQLTKVFIVSDYADEIRANFLRSSTVQSITLQLPLVQHKPRILL